MKFDFSKSRFSFFDIPEDTAFYVSYEMNGNVCKYYQMGHFGNTGNLIIAYDGHKAILNCRSAVEFTELQGNGESTETSYQPPVVRFLFQSAQVIEGSGELKQLHESRRTARTSYNPDSTDEYRRNDDNLK
ncbi:MAG: hypothetical protein LBS03_06670 [Bacteroidales bacterium]|jgi:hypothetical protein|nr:hypothetical protein [Bacteroidales bacterium]